MSITLTDEQQEELWTLFQDTIYELNCNKHPDLIDRFCNACKMVESPVFSGRYVRPDHVPVKWRVRSVHALTGSKAFAEAEIDCGRMYGVISARVYMKAPLEIELRGGMSWKDVGITRDVLSDIREEVITALRVAGIKPRVRIEASTVTA